MSNSFVPKITNEENAERFSEKMQALTLQAKESEVESIAQQLGHQYINLVGMPISPEALSLFAEDEVQQTKAVCFYYGGDSIRIGAIDPDNVLLQKKAEELKKLYSANVVVYMISEHSLERAVTLYGSLPKLRKVVRGVEITQDDIEKYEREIKTFNDLEQKIKDVSITEVMALIIAAALKARSSDIHIEAEEKGIKIRFRIDGILHDVASINIELWPKIISRIKLVAQLKINVSDKPQDGRFTIFMTDDKVDVRVSCLPTTYGESVVMRLLRSTAVGLSFEDLGIRGKAFEVLRTEINKPNGMIITTGPTGSGKTTTLYAILNKLNDSQNKIITIEDPVEYKLEGVNQSQVDYSKKYTFANGLRSILRQDPDIIMVGEIRDFETAEIGINAALTGHLVISTLHTNDAAGTVPRLLAMGVKPFLLAPAINAMIGQRLVRRVCPYCKVKDELDNQTLSKAMQILSEIPEKSGSKPSADSLKKIIFHKGSGCEQCQGLGYRGRIGIYEVVIMNHEIEALILGGQVSEYDMRTIAEKYGTVSMIQDGLLKALDGITSVDEVFRVAKDFEVRM